MKKKWWLIALSVVLVLIVLAVVFWDSVMIWIAPKVVLSGAIPELISALETRYQAGPALLLMESVDPEGKYTVAMDLDTSNALLGDIGYDMTVQTESSPRKIYAQGSVTYSGSTVDLCVYMDGDFAAVSSQELLQGHYYGVTYDTFAQDIRGNALLAYLVGEDTIDKWEESIAELRDSANTVRQLPDFARVDMGTALYGVLALKAQVRREVTDSDLTCHVISFHATGAEIQAALDQYLPEDAPEIEALLKPLTDELDSAVSVSFWLSDGNIFRVDLQAAAGGNELALELHTGMNPEKDDLKLLCTKTASEAAESYEVQVSTDYDETVYTEKVAILSVGAEGQNRTVLDYSWNRKDGDLVLNLTQGGEDTTLEMNLSEAENGFCVSTNQFETLMGMLNDKKKTGSSVCTMTVTKGSGIITPSYKNFDQWTAEDFILLLGGIGSLLGIHI